MKMNEEMNSVVHFGLPAEDKARMIDFYSVVFGWKAEELGPDMGNYVLVTTAETDEQQMLKKPGAINGGFFMKKDNDTHTKITIAVTDIEEAMKRVIAGGGRLIDERPMEMEGIGMFADIMDTEGNRVNLMQPFNSM